MNTRRLVPAVAAPLLAVTALTGCAGEPEAAPVPTVTVTATATVTAEPTAEPLQPRSYDDALTELDAWSLCWGAVAGANAEYWTLEPYSDAAPLGGETVVDNGDGSFDVIVMWAPTSGEGRAGEAMCTAGGTIGHPSVQLTGVRDYG